jgi:hypothetical protein
LFHPKLEFVEKASKRKSTNFLPQTRIPINFPTSWLFIQLNSLIPSKQFHVHSFTSFDFSPYGNSNWKINGKKDMIIIFFINFSVPKSIKNCHSVRKKIQIKQIVAIFSVKIQFKKVIDDELFFGIKCCVEIVMIISLSFFYRCVGERWIFH